MAEVAEEGGGRVAEAAEATVVEDWVVAGLEEQVEKEEAG